MAARLPNPRPVHVNATGIENLTARLVRGIEQQLAKGKLPVHDKPYVEVKRVPFSVHAKGGETIKATTVVSLVGLDDVNIRLGGQFAMWGSHLKRRGQMPLGWELTVHVPTHLSVQQWKIHLPTIKESVARILTHEFTHAARMPWIERGAAQQYRPRDDDEWRRYYNDPEEVEARATEIAKDVVDVVKARQMGRNRLSLDLLVAFSNTWNLASPWLTEANKRLILQKVAAFADEHGVQMASYPERISLKKSKYFLYEDLTPHNESARYALKHGKLTPTFKEFANKLIISKYSLTDHERASRDALIDRLLAQSKGVYWTDDGQPNLPHLRMLALGYSPDEPKTDEWVGTLPKKRKIGTKKRRPVWSKLKAQAGKKTRKKAKAKPRKANPAKRKYKEAPGTVTQVGDVTFVQLKSTWDPRFIAAVRAHYTGSKGPPVGKKMAWEILDHGQHRGWVGLGEPAYALAPRRRLGIADIRPLEHTVSNFIYRLDAPGPTKASTILKAWHPVAERDWEASYEWKPEHWETLVDASQVSSPVAGACFRKAGYRSLGETTGRSARRPPGHTHGPRVWGDASKKLVLYRGPLARIDQGASPMSNRKSNPAGWKRVDETLWMHSDNIRAIERPSPGVYELSVSGKQFKRVKAARLSDVTNESEWRGWEKMYDSLDVARTRPRSPRKNPAGEQHSSAKIIARETVGVTKRAGRAVVKGAKNVAAGAKEGWKDNPTLTPDERARLERAKTAAYERMRHRKDQNTHDSMRSFLRKALDVSYGQTKPTKAFWDTVDDINGEGRFGANPTVVNRMRPGMFAFDDSEPFIGYTDGTTWNGFARVWFSRHQLGPVLAYLKRTGNTVKWRGATLVVRGEDTGYDETFKPRKYKIDGTAKNLYAMEGYTMNEVRRGNPARRHSTTPKDQTLYQWDQMKLQRDPDIGWVYKAYSPMDAFDACLELPHATKLPKLLAASRKAHNEIVGNSNFPSFPAAAMQPRNWKRSTETNDDGVTVLLFTIDLKQLSKGHTSRTNPSRGKRSSPQGSKAKGKRMVQVKTITLTLPGSKTATELHRPTAKQVAAGQAHVWAQAESAIQKFARGLGSNTFETVPFAIRYEDGEVYAGKIEVGRGNCSDRDNLASRVRGYCKLVAGLERPTGMTKTEYLTFVSKVCTLTSECPEKWKGFLARYEIGSKRT